MNDLHCKGMWESFQEVVEEYFKLGHAEAVPSSELRNSYNHMFYLPMHAVHKSTTKLRVVFAKSGTGVSLNDNLMVGLTVFPPLIDILLRFRIHPIMITADISKMYRAVELAQSDGDLHFIWRPSPDEELRDY